jgi:hypothetical protein
LSELSGEPRLWIKNEGSEANPWLMDHHDAAHAITPCYGKVSDIVRGTTKAITFVTIEAARAYLEKRPVARRERNALYRGTVTGPDAVEFERVGDL